ncbi:MAG: chemotaxis protein CheW [Myxococcota bacterium]
MTMADGASTSAAHGRDWLELARTAARSWLAVPNGEPPRELLVVEVGGGGYAIPIERVREIVQPGSLTRIPRTPAWVVGAIALRGDIVEVVDLAQRLRRDRTSPGAASRIVVIHAEDEGVAGLLVDSVTGVLRASASDFVGCDEGDFRAVEEMVRVGESFFGVVDLDRVLGAGHGD